jgi:2-keto-4-pentenoate hydratase/2-oxohepta-3-ene-1,7-dioic acid hydratase in catechol pathway
VKIGRFSSSAGTAWGVLDLEAGTIRPLAGDITSAVDSPEYGGPPIGLDTVTLLAPVTPTTKIVGVGMNYMAHLERFGHERPEAPVAYFAPFSAIVGPDEEIVYPSITSQLDYEIELVAVVGRDIADPHRATNDLLGYTVGNDISARDARSSIGPDLFSMKANERSTPIGPWVTTLDELGGPGQPDLEISLRVNGEERQRDRTKSMIFTVDELLEYVLLRTSLHPGDVVFTGTTAGVGAEDGRFLQPGDVVEAEIEGIGVLRNTVGPRPR